MRETVKMGERTESFDPLLHWEQRLRAHPDITGVGYLGRSPGFIAQQYRLRMIQLELALRHYGLTDLGGRGYVPAHSYKIDNKVRSLAEYRDVLMAHGFVIESVRPATVLLSSPLEAPNRLAFLALLAWWKATGLWGRSNILASLIGPAAMKADQLACRLYANGNGPSAKIVFARKLD